MQTGFILTIMSITQLVRNQKEQHEDVMGQFRGLQYGFEDINGILPEGSVASQEDIKVVLDIAIKTRYMAQDIQFHTETMLKHMKEMKNDMKEVKDEMLDMKNEATRLNSMLVELMRSRQNPKRETRRELAGEGVSKKRKTT